MAKKFKFRLDPVLRFRERTEEDMRNRFLHIQAIRNDKQTQLDRLRDDAKRARESMNDAKQGNIDISKVRILNRYITGLSVSEQQRSGELKVIDTEVEKRRQEFVAARQQTKVMTNLKDRRKSEHEYEESQDETRQFDEIAGQKVVRDRKELLRLQALVDRVRGNPGPA